MFLAWSGWVSFIHYMPTLCQARFQALELKGHTGSGASLVSLPAEHQGGHRQTS